MNDQELAAESIRLGVDPEYVRIFLAAAANQAAEPEQYRTSRALVEQKLKIKQREFNDRIRELGI